MTIAERMRVLRAERGMSQTDLAQILETSLNAISKWERGETEPRAAVIIKLCSHFGVSADWVLGRTQFRSGLDPSKWILDMEVVREPIPGRPWCCRIPSDAKIVTYEEMRKVEKEIESRVLKRVR